METSFYTVRNNSSNTSRAEHPTLHNTGCKLSTDTVTRTVANNVFISGLVKLNRKCERSHNNKWNLSKRIHFKTKFTFGTNMIWIETPRPAFI